MASSLANVSGSRKRILVTDDNPVILATLGLALIADGYEVFTATSGSETVGAIQEFRPDLILLDLTFPLDPRNVTCMLEDGFAIIAWLRAMGGASETPIIIISSTDPEDYLERAQAARVLTVFQKPLDHDQLLQVIRATLADRSPAAARQSRSRPVGIEAWARTSTSSAAPGLRI